MKKIGDLLFSLLLLTSLTAEAAVKVQAFADRKEMGRGDTIDITVQVSSSESVEVGEPELPDLPNFEIMNSWTSTSTASKLAPGPNGMEFQTQKSVEFHYLLAPKREGVLTIPPFEVNVEGKPYKTAPFTIRVNGAGSGATQRPQGLPQEDPLDEAEEMFNRMLEDRGVGRGGGVPKPQVVPSNPNEAFFVYLDLDKREVYEGEQITANWYIYARGNILGMDRQKFPDLKGFWKEIIEEVPALNFTQEVLNGVAYRKALLASHALFPIKPGVAVIDEYKVKATIQLPTNPFGVFGFGKPYTYSRSSERVKINVKPLPTEGRPQDFSGAVGQFDVQAIVDGREFPINQPLSLRLRFEGEGNAKLIELPPLGLPAGLENYDSKSDAKFFKNGRSYKEFEILLIPREPGEVTIPAISVSLFDPKTAKYYTKKTTPITLKITGEKTAAAPVEPAPGAPKAQATPVKPQLPAILTSYGGIQASKQMPWMIFGAAGFLSLGLLGWKTRRELGRKERKATIQELLRGRMKIVRKNLKAGQWRETSAAMTNVIYAVLGAISGEGGASKELKDLLEKAPPSLRRDLGDEITKIVDTFQLLTFAPEGAVGNLKDPANLQTEIARAEKVLSRAIEHVGSES